MAPAGKPADLAKSVAIERTLERTGYLRQELGRMVRDSLTSTNRANVLARHMNSGKVSVIDMRF
jgi:hypothetical protein